MRWYEFIEADKVMAWSISLFLFLVLIGWFRHIAGRVLTKLYEFFIGSKEHTAPF
jgi:hypothetical protein